MTPEAWIALVALFLTLLSGLIAGVFRAGALLTNVKRDIAAIRLDLADIRVNHLKHIERDVAELKSRP